MIQNESNSIFSVKPYSINQKCDCCKNEIFLNKSTYMTHWVDNEPFFTCTDCAEKEYREIKVESSLADISGKLQKIFEALRD